MFQTQRELKIADALVNDLIDTNVAVIRKNMIGQRVHMRFGKYANRVALIDGVSVFGTEVQYLCMVLRSDEQGTLNTDAASRSYHPVTDFEIIEQKAS